MRLLWVDGAVWYHSQLTVLSFVMIACCGCGNGSLMIVNRLHGHQKNCGCEASKCGRKVSSKQIGLGGSGQKHVFFAQGARKVVWAESSGLG